MKELMRNILLPLVFLLQIGGCSPKSTFVLLPDKDGSVGEITVSNTQGTQTLSRARQSTTVGGNTSQPSMAKTLDQAKIEALFGKAIEIQPPPPTKYFLYFDFDSVQLTQESKSKLPQIVEITKERASNDVGINGHTDRSGNTKYNFLLSMKRAESIKNELLKLGIAPAIITTTSHGEGNPLIPTKDNTSEPLNRRVEVIVR